jgi:hypothetical protein
MIICYNKIESSIQLTLIKVRDSHLDYPIEKINSDRNDYLPQ